MSFDTDQWRVESKRYSCPVVVRGSVLAGDLEIVAKCYSIEGHTGEEVANLIAALPSLVRALKVAADVMRNNYLNESLASEFDIFTDAIDRAEGRGE